MHDPQTVAFDIRWPWASHSHTLGNGSVHKYYPALITIWHVDPERDAAKRGTRRDDTCGWGTVPTTPDERERIRKVGIEEWSTLFGKRRALADDEDYASVCYEPSTYDAVYWAWRRIKRESAWRKPIWRYGAERGRGYLSAAELEQIYMLASSPIDNIRVTVRGIANADDCADFFLLVYRCYRRFNRPWWKHPRWHFWHWKFQVHPWQQLRRWLFSRCAHCGKRFAWGESPVSFSWNSPPTPWFGSEVGVHHQDCANAVHATMRKERDEKTEGELATP